jgi:hypothetical protein
MTDSDDPLAFTPVPTASTRHDGWTPERQRRFVAALAAMGVVAAAARAVGKSATAAYRLRERPGADAFAAAWDIAVAMARDHAYELAMDRAQNGILAPRYYRGQQIGTVRRFDYRLALKVLDQRRHGGSDTAAVDLHTALANLTAEYAASDASE